MKMKNMNLLHTNYGNVLDTSCVKSRIFSYLPLLATVLMLTFGGWNSVVWGLATNGHVTIISGKGSVTLSAFKGRSLDKELSGSPLSTSSIGKQLDLWCSRGSTDNGRVRFFATPNAGYTFAGWFESSDCLGSPDMSNPKNYDNKSGWAWDHHDMDYTLYTKFTPNDYTIAYNNNGGSGSMSTTGAKYDASVTLRKNTFTNSNNSSYTVTYDADGGTCATASAVAGYSFHKWNTESNGTGYDYTDEQSGVLNLAASGTATLYAQWRPTTTLPSATKTGKVLEGWYNGLVRVGGAGEVYYPSASVTLTANWIDKHTPTMTGSNTALKVGEEQEEAFYLYQVDGPVANIDVVSISSINSGNGKVIEYDAVNNRIIARNAGTATIYFYQAETSTVKETTSATYTYTVTKNSNALKCAWNNGSAGDDWDENMNFDSKLPVKFSSTNTSGPAISVTQSPASAVATFKNGAGGANPDTIITNYREGSVTWTVSQAEDYKYIGDEVTCSVNVGTVYSNCYLVDDAPQREWSSQGNSGTYAFTLDQPGDTLFFDAERIDICVIGICEGNNTDWHIQYSTKMSPGDDDWTKLKDDKGNDVAIECEYKDTYYNGFKYAIPADARAIRFRTANVGSFGKKHIRNVKVGRKKWLTLENEGGSRISEIDMPINTIGGNVTRNTFYIDYSTCASKIKLVSNNSRIKFAANNSTTYEFDVENGTRKAIELTYTSPADAEEIEATITVYTPYEHETLTVNAETKGLLSTTLEYIGTLSYGVDHANMNATELFQVRDENGDLLASPSITLATSDGSKIAIVGGNAVDFLCGGSATITASYAGDANYLAASNLGQSITVNKLSDAIVWNNVRAEDNKIHVWADTVLTATMASANTGITYTIEGGTNVSVEGSTYTITTPGEVTLRATSAGSCTYASVTDTKQVVVDHCRHFLVWDQDFAALPPDDEEGHIDFSEALTAYAVDSTGVATGVTVNYSMPSVDFAYIEDGVLYVTGTGSTTITATTVSDDKFAVVSKTIAVNVLAPGDLGATVGKSTLIDNFNNEAKSVSWTSGHVTFTLSGNGLYTDKWVGSKYFYLYARSSTYTYELTWTVNDKDVNGNSAYIINVKKLTLDVDRASGLGTYVTIAGNRSGNIYYSGNIPAGGLSSGDLNLGEDGKITITVETRDAFWSNIAVNNINVLYTLLPVINTENQSVDVTVCDDNKQLLDLSECASLADRSAHAALSYRVISDNASDAHITADKKFYANSVGSYTVRAAVPQTVCHNPNTAEFTITVTPAALSLSPMASDITYRQALSASTLTGTATVGGCAIAGTWAWSAPATVPYVGEDQPFAVVFTPSSDADNYSGFTTTALVDVKRAQFIFDGSGDDEENKENWAIVDNWQSNADPGEEDVAIIRHDVIIAAEVAVYSLKIEGESKVTVAPTGGLTVGAGGIIDATKDNFKLQAGTSGVEKGQTGYLRISPDYAGAMPEATVELYSIGYYNKAERETQKAAWQFVGAPIADEGVAAKSVYTKSWIYSWDESTNNWVNNRATLTFSPFVGYETTQYKDASGLKLVYSGTLVSGVDIYALDLTYSSDGYNALANSFAAPIDISQFTALDFINAEPTISVLNTGTQEQSDNPGEDVNAPGKFLSIPVATATDLASSFGYPLVIPSMQGFFVQANSAGAKIKLDYNRLVWTADYSGLRENKPLRAPANTKDGQEELGSLKVTITANGWTDHTYLLESEKYADWYERGYDARKIMSEDMDIYTISGDEKLSVNATNSIIGTRVGVRTGGETAYTLVFTNLRTEDELALYDKETDEAIDINNYTEYTFFAEPNAEITDRFLIIERAGAPTNTTGVDDAEDEANVHKFIKDNQLYILKNGVLYNGTGARVK